MGKVKEKKNGGLWGKQGKIKRSGKLRANFKIQLVPAKKKYHNNAFTETRNSRFSLGKHNEVGPKKSIGIMDGAFLHSFSPPAADCCCLLASEGIHTSENLVDRTGCVQKKYFSFQESVYGCIPSVILPLHPYPFIEKKKYCSRSKICREPIN